MHHFLVLCSAALINWFDNFQKLLHDNLKRAILLCKRTHHAWCRLVNTLRLKIFEREVIVLDILDAYDVQRLIDIYTHIFE